MQSRRLHRLAKLLQNGVPLPDALEHVHGVLADEEILAVRFGAQSGILAASLRDMLEQPNVSSSVLLPKWRKMVFYVCVVLSTALFIVTFLAFKIFPEFEKISQEFDLSPPPSLQRAIDFAIFFAKYWPLIALAIIAGCWLVFTSWPGRRLRRSILGRVVRPFRELRVADVIQQLSIAADAGRPMAGALSTLARYHFDPALRHQLLFVRNEIEQGADVWQSMGAAGLLRPPEVRVLESSERIGNRPWALRQVATLKKRQTTRLLTRWTELALPLVIILLGGFVLFQALGVFSWLIAFVQGLAW
jgi:type II secretory pathway component PulF